ncbi:MAG: GNAT family N-acetyltransferase [Myxococcales bacterium]|nr:GNAT family N-acetyltransferase [Myxococcales bacterium]
MEPLQRDLFDDMGSMALGSRLKRLADALLDNAKQTYALYDVPIDPRWFPVFFVLSHDTQDGLSTGELARRIGQSHASVSQVVKALVAAGLARSARDPADGRANRIRLTPAGRAIVPRAERQYRDVGAAVDALRAQSHTDLLQAVREAEQRLAEQPMFDRVKLQYRARLPDRVTIVDLAPEHAEAFRQLNYAWIEGTFEIEETDRIQLDDPQRTILDPGGAILVALDQDEVLGCCALLVHGDPDDNVLELAKMAVAEHARGRQLGWLLGRAAIERARDMGAERLYLESNRRLVPAIGLYRRLGFTEIFGDPSPYARADIHMELAL